MENKLMLISCSSTGDLQFKIGNHIVSSSINRIFNWSSDTVDKNDFELVRTIKSGLFYYKNLINKPPYSKRKVR